MPSIFDYARHKLHVGEHDKGTVPLGLHPGTRITIKDMPLVFAEAAGSIVKDIKREAVISTLGFYASGDLHVFRAYFDDDNCFVEVPVKESEPEKPVHIRIFKTMNEDYPGEDGDLRRFLLTGSNGDEPLIGWFQFGFDDNKIIYDRSWMAGTNVARYVKPFHLTETLMDKTQTVIQHDTHDMMLYQRALPNDLTEYLLADWVNQVRTDGQAAEVFRTFIGIDITAADIEIFAT